MLLQILSELPNSQLNLTPTGIKIASITSSPELCLTDSQGMFYVKNGHEYELKQLAYLRSKRFPLPQVIAYDPLNPRIIATKDSGISMEAYFDRHISLKSKQVLLEEAGTLLRRLHKTLGKGVPEAVLRLSYKPTAHIVDCFFYKYPDAENRVPLDLYSKIKSNQLLNKQKKSHIKSPNNYAHFLNDTTNKNLNKNTNTSIELKHLIYLLDRIGILYMRRIVPHTYDIRYRNADGNQQTYQALEQFDEKPMYGDYKPENLIVEHIKNPKGILCIDPEIMLGTPIFDLAKFINRYLIDVQQPSHKKLIINFLDAYNKKINVVDNAYGPFTFLDLMTLDLLNLFKSLLSRYNSNEKHYRLALHLDDAEFCNKITQLLLDIQTIHSDEEFYNYLQQS